jgi:hypothetical protein
VIVLHGHKWEEHYGFVDRLRYRRVIDEVLHGRERGVVIAPLQWNADRAAKGEYGKALSAAVRRNVLKSMMASDQEVRAYLQAIRQPHCLVLQVTYADCVRCGDGLLPGLVAAWQTLLQGPPDAPQAIEPQYPLVLWINVCYDDAPESLPLDTLLASVSSLAAVLPILEPVRLEHVTEWMALPEVTRYVDGQQTRIRAALEEESGALGGGRLHMSRFVTAVRSLLEADGGRGMNG